MESHFCPDAPKPLGSYCHAVTHNDLVYVSGIASRHFVTNEVPGLVLDGNGRKVSYDIRAETRATLENIRQILSHVNSELDRILEINVFLTDMKDFKAYNEVFSEFFPSHRPARTTVAVSGLPGNISIEMKCIAVITGESR